MLLIDKIRESFLERLIPGDVSEVNAQQVGSEGQGLALSQLSRNILSFGRWIVVAIVSSSQDHRHSFRFPLSSHLPLPCNMSSSSLSNGSRESLMSSLFVKSTMALLGFFFQSLHNAHPSLL